MARFPMHERPISPFISSAHATFPVVCDLSIDRVDIFAVDILSHLGRDFSIFSGLVSNILTLRRDCRINTHSSDLTQHWGRTIFQTQLLPTSLMAIEVPFAGR